MRIRADGSEKDAISPATKKPVKSSLDRPSIHSTAGVAAPQWPGRPPPSSLYRGRPRGCQSRLLSELRRWVTRGYIMSVGDRLSGTGSDGCVKDNPPPPRIPPARHPLLLLQVDARRSSPLPDLQPDHFLCGKEMKRRGLLNRSEVYRKKNSSAGRS